MLDDADIEYPAIPSKLAEIGDTITDRGRSSGVKHTLVRRQYGGCVRILRHLAPWGNRAAHSTEHTLPANDDAGRRFCRLGQQLLDHPGRGRGIPGARLDLAINAASPEASATFFQR